MPLGHQQNMRGRARPEVAEGKDAVIFVNLAGRYLAGDDAAEEAIHNVSWRHRAG